MKTLFTKTKAWTLSTAICCLIAIASLNAQPAPAGGGPANDDCSGAIEIACGDVVTGSTLTASEQAVPTSNGGTVGQGVWYTFTGTGGDITLSLCNNTDFDSELNVVTTPDCATYTNVAGNDDNCINLESEVTFTSLPGQTYYLYVSDYISGGAGGNYELAMTCAAPANDVCAGALTVACGDVITGNTLATTSSDAPAGPFSISDGLWYTFVGTGDDITLSTCNAADFDTEISVSEGTCGSLTWVGGNDDNSGAGCTGNTSEYTFSSVAATTYYIYVGHWNSTAGDVFGTFDLSVTCACPTALDAGTLTPDASTLCLDANGEANLTATEGTAPQVPAGYAVTYVLTSGGTNYVIEQTSATADFTVTMGGEYTIHTLVSTGTLDLSGVVPGTTTAADVLGIVTGDDNICAALDVTGTGSIIVNAPEVGATIADATSVCLVGGSANIGGESDGNEVVPAGYAVAYVLTDADNGLEILDANATGDFTVSAGGNFIIHTFVYDPAVITDFTPYVGQSATVVVGLIADGTICAALDVTGAPITVNAPEVGATVADATPVCLDGGSADIGAESDGNEVVPAGYAVVYVLTDADNNLEILDANATGDFTVTAEGNFIIHTFVYDPVAVPDLTPFVGQSATVVVAAIGDGTICAALDVTGAPIVVEVCPTAPANDLCGDAEAIVCGGSATGSTVDATSGVDAVDCNAGRFGVWYVFTGTGDDLTVSLDNAGTDYDTYLGISETCGGVCVASDDDGGTGTTSEISGFTTVLGQDYYIYVSGFGTSTGNFELTVTCAPPAPVPANDLCANATPISCGDVVAGTNVGATEQSVPTTGGTVGAGVWYTFTGTGGGVTLSTCDDADFDTEINVVTTTDCISYTNVAGNDDGPGCTGFTSEVTFTTTVGETYYVYVSDYISAGGNEGTFNLTFACDPVTGISEALDNGMIVYPNPSNGEFVVEINGVEADVLMNVMDVTGRVVYTEGAVLNGNFRKSLNLDVASGTYLLQIATEEGLVTRKIQIH